MLLKHITTASLTTLLAIGTSPAAQADIVDSPMPWLKKQNTTPPVAAKVPWQEKRHGEIVTDNYRWLQKKDDPNVIAYLNAENAHTEAMTADIQPLAEKLFQETKARM
ncbi:MAG: oligopeptidase B, partial [Undibacterium curvum]